MRLRKSSFLGFGTSTLLLTLLSLSNIAQAKVVVFWEAGFPTVESEPLTQKALTGALAGLGPLFADEKMLADPATLQDAELLVLPYGSAVPADSWSAIERYVHEGGNLLILGGQPLEVPVHRVGSSYAQERAQDTYARTMDFRHTYAVPVGADAQFAWRAGYDLGPAPGVRAKKFFAVEGRLDGLGYMRDRSGLLVAAPVVFVDHRFGTDAESRVVALDFDPEPGYWETEDGISLIRQTAGLARQGAAHLSVEVLFSTLRPGEGPVLTVHVRNALAQKLAARGEVTVRLSAEGKTVETASIPVGTAGEEDLTVPLHTALGPGFYTVSSLYREVGAFRAYHENGFWVEPPSAVTGGPVLGVRGDFITRDGVAFFPVGTNYFSTESNGWDFSGPRNAAVWERDFAEMEQHGVSFVRTGVWMPYGRFVENDAGGGVNERFLRNLEAFLLCAGKHNIAVNFTFFAFAPRANEGRPVETPANPYLDPEALHAERAYVRSVVARFKDVPWLTWDLINEPSFSNPRSVFHGNMPNGDAVELGAWRKWLKARYDGDLAVLGSAWSVPKEELGGFDAVPLPAAADLNHERYGNAHEVRAVDYNLFAQDMFSNWVREMIALIRATGSKQVVDVGQDEGGVTDRVLNQFFGGAGVSFTTNHTYWQDDALLWDSVAAKRIGVPNITGETGYQPAWAPDGTWRYDEFTGLGLTERKWALGFAAGSTGAMQWDWDREVDFGMKRSDGSSKVWENQMRDLGEFARNAAPFATGLQLPEVALVLPQSLQLSVDKALALEAQQAAVRQIYGGARAEAYAVGEYQIDSLGKPKLIVLPSAYGLTDAAWDVIVAHVKDGATLLVTGPFDGDAHMHATGRQDAIGLAYTQIPLLLREQRVRFPWGEEVVRFTGTKTTMLSQAQLPDGAVWKEKPVGRGRILFCTLPLELSDGGEVLADAYGYALKSAGVAAVYTTDKVNPGILIAPTMFPKATLYVITSESNEEQVSFVDVRSGKRLEGSLEPGTAATLLVGTDGRVLAQYRWPGAEAGSSAEPDSGAASHAKRR